MNLQFGQAKRIQRGAAKHLVLLFALLFLALQTSTLVHSHNGDLHHHIDCTLCLKVGAGDSPLPATVPSLGFHNTQHRYEPLFEPLLFVAHVPTSSRDPPLVS